MQSGTPLWNKWVSAASACDVAKSCSVAYTGTSLANGTYKWRVQEDKGLVWTATQSFTLNIPLPPQNVVLGAPNGTLTSWDGVFHWTGITGPGYYLVQLQNASGTPIWNKWVSAASACDVAKNCVVTYTGASLANGTYKWRVQEDKGLVWTATQSFTLNIPVTASKRGAGSAERDADELGRGVPLDGDHADRATTWCSCRMRAGHRSGASG